MSRATARRGLPVMTAGVAAPADRRFKRPDVRPARRRRLGQLALRVARLALVGVVVLGGATFVARAFLGSRLLTVSHLVVRGNAQLSTSEVQTLVEGMIGQNILRVNFADFRLRLMDSPWVADATLWRVLPSTVGVEIVERVPMAIARLDQQLYLVDDKGIIIDEYGPQYREFDLPLVDGLVRSPSPAAEAEANPAATAVTGRFIEALRGDADLRRRVSQIDVSDPRDVVALLSDGPTLVHLGDTRFVERLRTYLELEPTLAQQFADVDSVDLRFEEKDRPLDAAADPTTPQMVVIRAKGKVIGKVEKSGGREGGK
jgi:cell division septal protein FtsQ